MAIELEQNWTCCRLCDPTTKSECEGCAGCGLFVTTGMLAPAEPSVIVVSHLLELQRGVRMIAYTLESFWKLFMTSVFSTPILESSKHMQRFLNEFSFRSNHRKMQNAMFDLLISRI